MTGKELIPSINDGYIYPPIQFLDFKVKQVSVGDSHSVVIDLNDNVWTFGSNQEGQLGIDNDNELYLPPTQIPNLKALQISAGYDHTLVLDLENNVWAFGSNKYEQCGISKYVGTQYRKKIEYVRKPKRIQGIKAKQVCAGKFCSIVIDLEDNLWVFGDNSYGQLGDIGIIIKYTQYDFKVGANVEVEHRIVQDPTILPNFKVYQVSSRLNHTLMIATLIK